MIFSTKKCLHSDLLFWSRLHFSDAGRFETKLSYPIGWKRRYFNRINFREIKFRDFANFCPFREIKTRENAWDCWLAKLNPPQNFLNRIFGREISQNSPFVAKNSHFQPTFRLIREIKSMRNFWKVESKIKSRKFFGSRNFIRVIVQKMGKRIDSFRIITTCIRNAWIWF